MRKVLSVSLPKEMANRLNRITQQGEMTRSEVVKRALREFLFRYELEEIREKLVPKARAKGIFIDEDVFRMVS